jgi:alpha-glucosidase (family GH31 glycosyl hydrolase)
MTIPTHFQIPFKPVASPEAVVSTANVRFTVLASRLIRLEYSPSGQFEDHPTQTFWYREQPVASFTVERTPEQITIRTEHLLLIYTINPAGFTATNLSIEVFATNTTWYYGMQRDRANLRGTTRTLDGVNGSTRLDAGLMSRHGWSLFDDSATLVFNPQGWIDQRAHPENLDLYFFGYGHDYLGCLREFSAVAGEVPMIPRWALGNWWSRYWKYSQQEYLDLMAEFKQREIPLSVCVIDMDWHLTHTGNRCSGWTGYTWNRELFPDPAAFLKSLKDQNLKATLNVHPAEGVHPHEEQYPEMAARLGVDPASQEPVLFDIPDPTFANAYFEVLHHPQEAIGIDFWWIDWQQGDKTKMAGLDPLYWLNHLHFYDLARDKSRRPFIFSRWGGLGSHRYTIGFSGDTVTTWDSLAFQPYFTATAANVGYSWWSHDIGGHMGGIRDGELYSRWVQYGVFSPILRMHSTATFYHDRRPWAYDAEVFKVSQAAFQMRYALIPYIYSMAWRNHVDARPMIVPMYYTHPEFETAYRTPNQYWFGTELIAAPFITPRDADTRLSSQPVWLPEGDWFDFFSGEHLPGGRWHTFYGTLADTPLVARAGAIVPFGPKTKDSADGNPEMLEVHLFPGASNAFELYEDDGQSEAYRQNHSCRTILSQQWGGDTLIFKVAPAEGELSQIPAQRTWNIALHGIARPDSVTLALNGVAQAVDWSYGAESESLEVAGISLTPSNSLELRIAVNAGSLIGRRDRRPERIRKLLWNFLVTDVNTCQELDNRIPELLSGLLPLEFFATRLSGGQMNALRETIG